MTYTVMSESEILHRVMEQKNFASVVADIIRDNATDEDFATIVRRLKRNRPDGVPPDQHYYDVYYGVVEALGPSIDRAINHLVEEFKDQDRHLVEVVREPDSYPLGEQP